MSRQENGWCSDLVILLSILAQDPNPEDPLNKEAAEMMQNNLRSFESMVARSVVHGATINGTYFPASRR